MQKIGKLFILILVVAGLASCGDDTETAPFEVIGEAIMVKRKINDETKYARAFYAYGNQRMSSASVTLPEGGTIDLVTANDNGRTFQKLPAMTDFTSTVPETGQFDFTVVNEDIEHSVTESLTFDDLDFANIDSISYSNGTVHVEWELSGDAEAYLVRMFDENNQTVFIGQLMGEAVYAYEISQGSGVWDKTPENGKTYVVEVHAFAFESGSSSGTNYLYNVDELAISTANVVWGE